MVTLPPTQNEVGPFGVIETLTVCTVTTIEVDAVHPPLFETVTI